MSAVPPSRALVRPRVISQVTGECLLLEDVIEPILARAEAGAICVFGPPGSGKTSALRALSGKIPKGAIVELLDEPDRARVTELADRMIVLYTGAQPHDLPHLGVARLAPWGEDEALEYLLAVHKDRCASVMTRLRKARGRDLPDLPELWTIGLDRMAEDESIADVDAALRRHLDQHLPSSTRIRAREICFKKTVSPEAEGVDEVQLWGHHGFLGFLLGAGLPADQIRVVRDPRIRRILAAEQLVNPRDGRVFLEGLKSKLPEALVATAGKILRDCPSERAALEKAIQSHTLAQPMGASLLHASQPGWRPADFGRMTWFWGAYLRGAEWPGLRLPNVQFSKADLSGANLRGAALDDVQVSEARLRNADLSEASLHRIKATGADLSGADLSGVFARKGTFINASLAEADLEAAALQESLFMGADLTKARFCRADLKKAVFQVKFRTEDWMEGFLTLDQALAFMNAKGYQVLGEPARKTEIGETDFTGADLQEASLQFADLRTAVLDGALLMAADLQQCNLEGVSISGARFNRARLHSAVLTGSVMPGASFRSAFLTGARLADIDWERADLRYADLRKVVFHLGTSRSGLVFGAPSEGTRNGFYTDDFGDQSYRSPEEIRVANLRGADLRGALLEGTDFYLVDLRDARITSDQEEYLRRCGAILETRV